MAIAGRTMARPDVLAQAT